MSYVDKPLAIASLGIPIAFLPAGKKASDEVGWQDNCTTSAEEITKRAQADPSKTNYACVAKAEEGGFLFLDDDGGIRIEFEKVYGKMPPTLKAQTCNGAYHYYFSQTPASLAYQKEVNKAYVGESNGKGELWSLRMHNSYVVGIGSVVPNKQGQPTEYKLAWNAPIIPIPDVLLEFLKERHAKSAAVVNRKSKTWMDEPIPQGRRNKTLHAIGSALRRIGMDEDSIYAVLSIKNQNQCSSPLSDDDIRTITHSAASYEPEKTTLLIDGKPINGVDALKPTPQQVAKTNPIPLWNRATPFCEIEDTPMEWIIPGLIVKGESTIMTGDFGSFKSYMTYFIADAVTEGGTFVRRTAQKHSVLVLDRENSKSTISLRRYLVGNLRDKKNAKLLGRFTTPVAPEITDAELLELCRTIRPFIIIDSMQDFHPGKKENDTDDMTQFSIEVNRLVDAGAAAVLIIHHVPKTGKGKGGKYRGATAIPGGVAGALFVEKIGRTGVKIEGFKTRDGEDSMIELILKFPSEAEINAKTGRVTYTIVRGGINRSSELKGSVLSYVREHGKEKLSRNKIAKGMGGDRNEILGLVNSLVAEGELVETDLGITVSDAKTRAQIDAAF